MQASHISVMFDVRNHAINKDVSLTAIHMQESEGQIIFGNSDDVEWSWTNTRFEIVPKVIEYVD